MFSWVALDRFAEKERARDRTFRKQSARKVLRSDAKQLTDDDLLARESGDRDHRSTVTFT